MRVGLGRDLGELGDDVRRWRAVGVAHAEVDDVLAARAGGRLHRVDLSEDVRRQAADAVEIGRHGAGSFVTARRRRASAPGPADAGPGIGHIGLAGAVSGSLGFIALCFIMV